MSCAPVPKNTARREPGAARGDILTGLPGGELVLIRDGLLVWDADGTVLHAGPATTEWLRVPLVTGSPRALIAAAFWDPHVHLPQLGIAGLYREPLLEWLGRRVFPEEMRHADPQVAEDAAVTFFDALIEAGTIGAGVFAAPFVASAEAAISCARRRELPVVCGPSLMDCGEPVELIGETDAWIAEQSRLMVELGSHVAVVPRFALSCSAELLRACGRLARTHRARVLGHVSENEDEVRAVVDYWKSDTYAEIYEHCGLLGPRTILAHGVHLSEVELQLLSFSRTWIAHAPTSNLALRSGRMPLEKLREQGVRWCLCSDVGAGPELCLLHVVDAVLNVHRGHAEVTPEEAYWRATSAGADALGFGEERGALMTGRQADFVVVNEGLAGASTAGEAVVNLVEHARQKGWRSPFDAVFVSGCAHLPRAEN